MSSTRTIGSFAYTEQVPGTNAGGTDMDPKQDQEVRIYKIAYADLLNFIDALRGGWLFVSDAAWNYRAPDQHPTRPLLWCLHADYEVFGSPTWDAVNKVSSWDYAIVTATYKSLPFNPKEVNNKAVIDEELDIGGRVISIPNSPVSVYKEDLSGKDVTTPMSKVIPYIEYTVTMENIPALPGGSATAIAALVGTVNKNTFQGADGECMMFQGGKCKRKTTSASGSATWTVTLKWKWQGLTWNNVLVNGADRPIRVVAKNGGKPLYDDDGGTGFDTLLPRG